MTSSAIKKDQKLTDTTIICNYETLEQPKEEKKNEVNIESSKIERELFVSLPPVRVGSETLLLLLHEDITNYTWSHFFKEKSKLKYVMNVLLKEIIMPLCIDDRCICCVSLAVTKQLRGCGNRKGLV